MKLKNGSLNYSDENKKRTRKLRNEPSTSERVMWELLRKNKTGHRFKRQVPIGPYILDFYCPASKVCVEVDGEQHADRQPQDKTRDQELAKLGILTIRIPSLDLFDENHTAYAPWIKQIQECCCIRM